MIRKFLGITMGLLPFWTYLVLFKLGGGVHYGLLSPLGEKVFPIWLVGVLVGMAAFLQVLLDVPAGYLLDRFGYKRLLKATTLVYFCASAFLLFGLNELTFFLTLFGSTFGWLFFGPGTNAYVIDRSKRDDVGEVISIKDVFSSVGIVLSSAVIIFAVHFEANSVGLILSVIFLAAYMAISLSPKDASIPDRKRFSHHVKHRSHVISEAFEVVKRLSPASVMLILSGFTGAMFYAIVWFVVPLLMAHTEQNGVLGLGLGIFDLSVVALGFVLGKMVDSYDKKMMALLGLLVFAVFGTLLGFDFGILFLFMGFMATVGDELSTLALWAWAYNIDKKKDGYGLISGVIGVFEDIGWTIGPILAGFLYGVVGPSLTIAVGGGLILINLVVFFILSGFHAPVSQLSWPKKRHRTRHRE